MIDWVIVNKQWLFSGIGLVVVLAIWRWISHSAANWRLARALPEPTQWSALRHTSVRSRSLTTYLPNWLLKSLFTPEQIAKKIRIGPRENNPVARHLGTPIPEISLYFQITNLSPLDLILDRLIVQAWFAQPAVFAMSVNRDVVPSGEITEGVAIRQFLTAEQAAFIKTFYESPQSSTIQIWVLAYFDSRVGTLTVQRSIELQR